MDFDNGKFDILRRKAERIMETRADKKLASDDAQLDFLELLHELEVHQVELELQNRELLETQAKLQQSREHYRDLFEQAPVAYFIIDDNGEITQANDAAIRLLDASRSSLIGVPFARHISTDDKDKFYLHQRKVLKTGQNVDGEMQMQRPDGQKIDVRMSCSRVQEDSGRLRCAVIDISDIQAARREMDKALQKQKEITELQNRMMTSMSHELRTPLSIIMSAAQMLDRYYDKISEEDRQRRFNTIYDNVMYLTEMAQEVIINHNENTFQAREPDEDRLLREVFKDIIEYWQNEEQEVLLYFDLADDTQISLWDLRTLRRIMYNLLDNAQKYSDDVIKVIVTSDQDDVKLQVEDNGRGIPADDLPHVFEVLYRGKNVQDQRGMGIGLYTVKSTVDTLDGQIEIESAANRGTIVTIILPLER